jgi:hypothetical protein
MIHSPQALDERWYKELSDIYISDVDWLTTFSKITDRERERFFQGEVENPHFSQKQGTPSNLPAYEQAFLTLQAHLLKDEKNPVVQKLYLDKVERHLAFIPMYAASERTEDETFFKHSVTQYGKPKKAYFTYIAKRMKDLVKAEKGTTYPEARTLINKVFSKIDTANVRFTQEILPPVATGSKKLVDSATAVRLFEEALQTYGITDWHIVLDESGVRKRFAVNAKDRKIHVPNDVALSQRAYPLTVSATEALVQHEVGVHALRSYNGSKQPLKLLSLGLAGYIRGEEGLATYVQQQTEGATEFYGFERYMAISLAIGMDGIKRDFRSVFDIMEAYYLLHFGAYADAPVRARKGAWQVCERTFRGSTGRTAGTVYTRDIVYLEGNIGTWNLLIDKPDIFESLFVGKFDQLNPAHVTALSELGIIEPF